MKLLELIPDNLHGEFMNELIEKMTPEQRDELRTKLEPSDIAKGKRLAELRNKPDWTANGVEGKPV